MKYKLNIMRIEKQPKNWVNKSEFVIEMAVSKQWDKLIAQVIVLIDPLTSWLID